MAIVRLGIEGLNPGFGDQNAACFRYTNPHHLRAPTPRDALEGDKDTAAVS